MGEAVTHAAQWYEQTGWVGVHYTLLSYLRIEHFMEGANDRKESALLRYDIPVKNREALRTYAVNWPKLFKVSGQRPRDDEAPRGWELLEFLSGHKVQFGTERKYVQTVAFFDVAISRATKKPAQRKR
jgi:hypothetical protein